MRKKKENKHIDFILYIILYTLIILHFHINSYLVLKQNQRARNQLKRVARTPWTPEKAEWLEACWLLLADCLLTSGSNSANIEAAKDALDRTLKYNKSCSSAYEYCGIVIQIFSF